MILLQYTIVDIAIGILPQMGRNLTKFQYTILLLVYQCPPILMSTLPLACSEPTEKFVELNEIRRIVKVLN
jgi:hypothetical protein